MITDAINPVETGICMNYAVQDFAYGVTVAQTETDNHTSRQFVGEDNHKITCNLFQVAIRRNYVS